MAVLNKRTRTVKPLCDIGARLESLRIERKLKKSDLLILSGVNEGKKYIDSTVRSYNFWIHGDQSPDLSQLIKLADFYNVSLDYILCRSDCRNVGNKEMTEALGLTEDAIEVLRRFKRIKSSRPDSRVKDSLAFLNRYLRLISSLTDEELIEKGTIFSLMDDYAVSNELLLDSYSFKYEKGFRAITFERGISLRSVLLYSITESLDNMREQEERSPTYKQDSCEAEGSFYRFTDTAQ